MLKMSEEEAEKEEAKRARAFEERDQRIKETMTRMGDTVIKDREAAERAFEQRILQ
jgi:hypothetical protein